MECPLNNGYVAKFVDENGVVFCSVEQYMMYKKADMFAGNENIKLEIMGTDDYDTIKACGRRVTNFVPEVWSSKAEDIVQHACMLKFAQNSTARGHLLGTGSSDIEQINPNDPTWSSPGKNLLGKILMRVRDNFWSGLLV